MENRINYSNNIITDTWDPTTESLLDSAYDQWISQEQLLKAIENHDMKTISYLFPLKHLATFKLDINERIPVKSSNGQFAPIHLAIMNAINSNRRDKWDIVLHLLATKKINLNLKMKYDSDIESNLSVQQLLEIHTEWMIHIAEFCLNLKKSTEEQREMMGYLFSIVKGIFPEELGFLQKHFSL